MMSPIPESLVNEQVELERSQVSQGLKRLNDNTFKLEDKSYASATVYGITSIDTLLPLVTNKITITKNNIREGKNGPLFKEIVSLLYVLTLKLLTLMPPIYRRTPERIIQGRIYIR